jgi:hypothetical protein
MRRSSFAAEDSRGVAPDAGFPFVSYVKDIKIGNRNLSVQMQTCCSVSLRFLIFRRVPSSLSMSARTWDRARGIGRIESLECPTRVLGSKENML